MCQYHRLADGCWGAYWHSKITSAYLALPPAFSIVFKHQICMAPVLYPNIQNYDGGVDPTVNVLLFIPLSGPSSHRWRTIRQLGSYRGSRGRSHSSRPILILHDGIDGILEPTTYFVSFTVSTLFINNKYPGLLRSFAQGPLMRLVTFYSMTARNKTSARRLPSFDLFFYSSFFGQVHFTFTHMTRIPIFYPLMGAR